MRDADGPDGVRRQAGAPGASHGHRPPNQAAGGEIYKRVQNILAADLPVVTLHETVFYDAASADTKGTDNEGFLPSWREGWLDR